jgi:hypothetical protein
MKKISMQLLALLAIWFFTACGGGTTSQSSTSTNAENTLNTFSENISKINIYGTLPASEKTSIEVIFDINNNGSIDQNESNHKKTYKDLFSQYALNQLETYYASKMWITYSSENTVSQTKIIDITTDKYPINIDNYIPAKSMEIPIERTYKYVVLVAKILVDNTLALSYEYTNTKVATTDLNTLQLFISLQNIETPVSKIKASFSTKHNLSLLKPHEINHQKVLLDIQKYLIYHLYDQNNTPLFLQQDSVTYQFANNHKLFAYEQQTMKEMNQTGRLNTVTSGEFIVANTVTVTQAQNICVDVKDANAQAVKSILVEAHAPLNISSKYTDKNGQTILQIYQAFDQYQFDYTMHEEGIYNRSFTPVPSTKNNCSYEVTLTTDNTENRSLNLQVIEENNISLEGEYIYAHNSDYSFYTYGYLSASNTLTMSTPLNQALTVVIGTQKYSISKSETDKVLPYTKANPFTLSLSFRKDAPSDDFPKLFVKNYAKNILNVTPNVTQTLQTNNTVSTLQLERREDTNNYQLLVYKINETMPGNNVFKVHLDSFSKTIDYNIEDYPTEFKSISFVDYVGNKHDTNETLYTNVPYIINYTISDKNNNIASISNNLLDPITNVFASVGQQEMIIKVNYLHSNLNTSKSFSLNIQSYYTLIDNSTFPTSISLKELNNYSYTFDMNVTDIFGNTNNFDTKIYTAKPSLYNPTPVSYTNSYTYDFRTRGYNWLNYITLYYVVSSPLGYQQTFSKKITLIDYQSDFVDNSIFPSTVDYAELVNLSYTFELNIEDTLKRDENFSINIAKNNEFILTGTAYTHDFKNEKAFELKYTAVPSLGYFKSFIKNIQLVNYNPVLKNAFTLASSYPLGTSASLDVDVIDLAGNPYNAPFFSDQ